MELKSIRFYLDCACYILVSLLVSSMKFCPLLLASQQQNKTAHQAKIKLYNLIPSLKQEELLELLH